MCVCINSGVIKFTCAFVCCINSNHYHQMDTDKHTHTHIACHYILTQATERDFQSSTAFACAQGTIGQLQYCKRQSTATWPSLPADISALFCFSVLYRIVLFPLFFCPTIYLPNFVYCISAIPSVCMFVSLLSRLPFPLSMLLLCECKYISSPLISSLLFSFLLFCRSVRVATCFV